jgi:nitrate reductase NapAB chaperone NapD
MILIGGRVRPKYAELIVASIARLLVLEVRKDSSEDGQLIAVASEEKEYLYHQ